MVGAPAGRGTSSRRVSATSAERFARRARGRHWAAFGRALAVALVLCAVAGLAWLLLVSDVVGVRHVQVTGNVALDASRVRTAADVPAGMPMVRVDAAAVEERIGRLPRVAQVTVHRRWPHTLSVRVVERTAQAAVPVGGWYALMDAGGAVFGRVRHPPSGMPVVAGSLSSYSPQTRRAVGRVLAGLPERLRSRVDGVAARSIDSVVLMLSNRSRVVWGSAENADAKATVLRSLMRQPARVYDVSAPQAPSVRR